MNIELADNGIIIRNPEYEDEVTLAISNGLRNSFNEKDMSDEYRAIGQKVYSWLMDVVMPEHEYDLRITGFDLVINATCKGRAV